MSIKAATAYLEDLEELLKVINTDLQSKEQEYDNLRFDLHWTEEKAVKITTEVVRLRAERRETLKHIGFSRDITESLKKNKRHSR